MTNPTNLPATIDPETLEHVVRECGVERRFSRTLSPEEEQAEREDIRDMAEIAGIVS